MTTERYINRIRNVTEKESGTRSDYAVAKLLGISQDAVNRYRKGERAMSATVAFKVAQVLRLPPAEVIAAAELERAKSTEAKAMWRKRMTVVRRRSKRNTRPRKTR